MTKKYKIWTEGGKELNVFSNREEAIDWIGRNHYEIIGDEIDIFKNELFIVKKQYLG